MNLRNEKGFTGIDISVSVIIIFIFVSIIATLVYQINSTSKEIQLKSEATYLAINEIENIKNQGFEAYKDRSISGGNSIVTQDEEVQEGYFKTTTIIDYTDIQGNEEKTKDIVKKACNCNDACCCSSRNCHRCLCEKYSKVKFLYRPYS